MSFARFAMIGLAALLLAGCGTSLPQTQAGDPQAPIDFALLTDIPIPSGATLDADKSLILGDRDRWHGKVVIKLWKAATDAANFYTAQMPAFGWEPVMSTTSGVSFQSWVRGNRAANLQFESGLMYGSKVTITVGPRSSNGVLGPSGPAPRGDFSQLVDVPVPPGAAVDADKSLILGDASNWQGQLVLKLPGSGADAASAYQGQMQQAGWQPVMNATSGISVQSFVRGDRAANVVVQNGTLFGSYATVTVGPKAEMLGAGAAAIGGAATAAPQPKVKAEPLAPPKR